MAWFDRFLAFLDDRDTHAPAAQVRTFELIVVMLSITELWKRGLEVQRAVGELPWLLPLYVTLCGVAAFLPAWRQIGFLSLALGMAGAVWDAFPSTGNHVYLECFLCGLCALLDTSKKEERRLLTLSLRWITCVIMLFAGIQKLVHGYYITGLMPAFLLQEPRFRGIFALLLPDSETQRILSYSGLDGSGPYFVSTPLWLLSSNLVWILELVIAAALLVPQTRRLAVFIGMAFVALIEIGAREILFGLLYVNLLLMFLGSDANRRFLPIVVLVCLMQILTRLGWLPDMEIH